jgi:hypothetical protein
VYGLQIINISNPAVPTFAGVYATPDVAHNVFVQGNYAYVADNYAGIQIINISNPTNPALTASYGTPASAYGVFISNNYAYIATADNGLRILDVSVPSNPSFIGNYITPGISWNVFVSGNYSYVADHHSVVILYFYATGIEENAPIPSQFTVLQSYPNPFNAQTTIQYSLPKQSDVTIDIFDILGRKIETIAEGTKPAGEHQVIWNASRQASGVYFYRIKAGDKVETKKMVLMK